MKKVGEITLHSPIRLAGVVAKYLILNISFLFLSCI